MFTNFVLCVGEFHRSRNATEPVRYIAPLSLKINDNNNKQNTTKQQQTKQNETKAKIKQNIKIKIPSKNKTTTARPVFAQYGTDTRTERMGELFVKVQALFDCSSLITDARSAIVKACARSRFYDETRTSA